MEVEQTASPINGRPPPVPQSRTLRRALVLQLKNDSAQHSSGCKMSDAAFFLERAECSSTESLSPLAGRRELNLKVC